MIKWGRAPNMNAVAERWLQTVLRECLDQFMILGEAHFRHILREYQVDTAHDGPAGLALIRARPCDVAVLDYKMPGMTGLELYQKIRESRRVRSA